MTEDEINDIISKFLDPKYETCSGTQCKLKRVRYTRSLDACIHVVEKVRERVLYDEIDEIFEHEHYHYWLTNPLALATTLAKAIRCN